MNVPSLYPCTGSYATMSHRTRHTPPRHERISRYRYFLDVGCRRTHLGGIRVWRSLKAVALIMVLSFGFWGGVTGTINPPVAFAGMLIAYVGLEQVESLLVTAGEQSLSLSLTDGTIETDGEDDDVETDGGRAAVKYLRERDG